MATQQDELAVVRQLTIEATPETIFPFFTDPEKMTQWKAMVADLDAVPGGTYHVNVTEQAIAVGEYVEIDPPNRVVLTWGWEGSPDVPPGSGRVEITLEAQGSSTLLTLTHTGLPNEHARAEHTEGWDHYLGRLQIAAAGGDAGRDPMLDRQTA